MTYLLLRSTFWLSNFDSAIVIYFKILCIHWPYFYLYLSGWIVARPGLTHSPASCHFYQLTDWIKYPWGPWAICGRLLLIKHMLVIINFFFPGVLFRYVQLLVKCVHLHQKSFIFSKWRWFSAAHWPMISVWCSLICVVWSVSGLVNKII